MRREPGFGFTLIEMLVVLIVIGISAGLVYAKLQDDPRQTALQEARRFAAALEHAALLAQWRNQTLGFSAAGTVYRFWRKSSDGGWAALSDDDVLAPHALAPTLSVMSQTYGTVRVPAEAILPLRANGRNEPYQLEIVAPEWRVELVADPLNRVTLIGPLPR